MLIDQQRGFTLIELLVVIAIISLLSSIVLVSLSSSRGKAQDAIIKQELVHLRSQAELYYSRNNHYGTAATTGSCTVAGTVFMDADARPLIVKIEDANSTSVVTCRSTTGISGAWAASSPLRSNSALHWCVDSRQRSKQIGAAISGTACP